ncbi:hypothetical protein MRX96_013277 [Rhipicephalus microplus]
MDRVALPVANPFSSRAYTLSFALSAASIAGGLGSSKLMRPAVTAAAAGAHAHCPTNRLGGAFQSFSGPRGKATALQSMRHSVGGDASSKKRCQRRVGRVVQLESPTET